MMYLTPYSVIIIILIYNSNTKPALVPKTDEVTGEWRRLHNEELNDLYSSPNNVRVIKWR